MSETPIGDELERAAQFSNEADVDPAQAVAFGVGEDNPPPPPGPNSPPVDEDNAPLDPVEQALDPGLDVEPAAAGDVEVDVVNFDDLGPDDDDETELDASEGGVEAMSVEGLPDVDEPEDDDPDAEVIAGEWSEAGEAEPDDPFGPEYTGATS